MFGTKKCDVTKNGILEGVFWGKNPVVFMGVFHGTEIFQMENISGIYAGV